MSVDGGLGGEGSIAIGFFPEDPQDIQTSVSCHRDVFSECFYRVRILDLELWQFGEILLGRSLEFVQAFLAAEINLFPLIFGKDRWVDRPAHHGARGLFHGLGDTLCFLIGVRCRLSSGIALRLILLQPPMRNNTDTSVSRMTGRRVSLYLFIMNTFPLIAVLVHRTD